ncbi:hypothetical protein DXG01_003299, partial [Tephrocybe rancida]
HCSTQQRDAHAPVACREALSELISQPGQSGRRPPAPAPTQGEQGQALAAQRRWGKKTRGSGPPRGSSTHPAPQAPFAPPERLEEPPAMSQQVFGYTLPLATDSAGLESDPEDVTDEEIFIHENMPSDGDGDATLRAAPNLHMLQTLNQNPQSQFMSHGWGPGPDSESMLDTASSAASQSQTQGDTGNAPASEPMWEFDPLPPNSTLYTPNPQPGLVGPVVDTLQRHQDRRGRAQLPDPATLAQFSNDPQRTVSHLPSVATSSGGRGVVRSSSRASIAPSEQSSTSIASSWTLGSVATQQVGQTGPQWTVYICKRSKQSEMPQGHAVLTPAKKIVVRCAQDLLIEELLTQDAFPDKLILKLRARTTYETALITAHVPPSIGSAPTIPTALAIKSIKAVASIWCIIKSHEMGNASSIMEFSRDNCGGTYYHVLNQLRDMESGRRRGLNGLLRDICSHLFDSRLEGSAPLGGIASNEDDYFDDDAPLDNNDNEYPWVAN